MKQEQETKKKQNKKPKQNKQTNLTQNEIFQSP